MKRKIFSILFALVLVLSLSLVTVVPVGANTDRLVPSAYATIQLAIDAADPGDTIIVADGTYVENIVVNKSLTIQAAGSLAIIDGGTAGTVVDITATDVTVSGFTITGTAAATNVFTDCGITLTTVSGCTIEDNIVDYDGGIGIKLQEANVNNAIRRNSIVGSSIAGIALFGSSSNTVDSNVSNDTIQVIINGNSTGYGIWLDYSPPEGDAPLSCPGPGYSTLNTINNNTFSLNEEDGVYFGQDGNVNTLTNNIITNNGTVGADDGHGVSFWQSGLNTVTGNTITGNYASGMDIYASPDNVITHNTITGNNVSSNVKRGGFRIRDGFPASTGNHINNNNISGNQVWGIFCKTASVVDATENWWGDASGPKDTVGTSEVPPCTSDPATEMNADGTGDEVSDNVDYCPWLTAAVGATVSMTAETPQIVAISVTPTSVDFGILSPGQTSSSHPITVENIGTVVVDVTTSIDETGTFFYDNLYLNAVPEPDVKAINYEITSLAVDGTKAGPTDPSAFIVVPSNYDAQGTETGTLVFEATATGS